MSRRRTASSSTEKLLSISAWIRRQSWLRAIYRHFSPALRNKVSEALASRAHERFKFRRSVKWKSRGCEPTVLYDLKRVAGDKYKGETGVNIFAYARGQFGLAEAARQYARALLAEGYPVAIYDIQLDLPHGMDDTSLDPYIGESTPYGINLVFVNPDYLNQALASIGNERLGQRHTIACWFWELERFPEEWLPALHHVDEVMASSSFIEASIKRITDKPVWNAPLPVGELHDSGLERADFGLEDDSFIFLTSFDFNSFLARKNPIGVIEAFRLAFADQHPNVRLLIKSSNGHRHPARLQELLSLASGDPRIVLRDEVIERSNVQALQRCVDVYVSLHRAEGFGLGLAECMRLGKPVIATAWSGNMEFMTADNSCLVDYKLVPVGKDEYLHYQGQRWAEPDINHAAMQMRRLVEDRAFAARIGAQAARDVRERLSPQASATAIIQRLKEFSSRRDATHASDVDSHDAHSTQVDAP